MLHNHPRLRPFATVCVCLSVLVYPLSGLALEPQSVASRIEQIKKLSKVERNRLDRNVEEFTSLSNSEKDRYRLLHQELSTDRAKNGVMFSLMQTYCLWVQTLSPIQQHELQRETNIAKKMVLVRKFKEEQEKRLNDEHDSVPETSEPAAATNTIYSRIQGRILTLDKRDLDSAMEVLLNDLPADRRRPEFDPPRLSQYCQIINEHARWKNNDRQWPGDDLLKKLKKSLHPQTERVIEHASESPRETLIRLMLMGILRQASDPVRKVTDEDREKIAAQLSTSDQEKLKKIVNAEKRKQLLNSRYFELKNDDSFKKSQECRDQIIHLFEQFDVPLPKALERAKSNRPVSKG